MVLTCLIHTCFVLRRCPDFGPSLPIRLHCHFCGCCRRWHATGILPKQMCGQHRGKEAEVPRNSFRVATECRIFAPHVSLSALWSHTPTPKREATRSGAVSICSDRNGASKYDSPRVVRGACSCIPFWEDGQYMPATPPIRRNQGFHPANSHPQECLCCGSPILQSYHTRPPCRTDKIARRLPRYSDNKSASIAIALEGNDWRLLPAKSHRQEAAQCLSALSVGLSLSYGQEVQCKVPCSCGLKTRVPYLLPEMAILKRKVNNHPQY